MIFTEWKRVKAYGNRKLAASPASTGGLKVVEYELKTPSEFHLAGKRLLFFSDIHWGNSESKLASITEIAQKFNPEWIVFGGDLTNYACFFDKAFDALGNALSGITGSAKIAAPGNWDRRRKCWFPNSLWTAKFAEIGFHYLINESSFINGILFQGLDDPRNGHPAPSPNELSHDHLNCVISHNPATAADFAKTLERIFPNENERPRCLCLSGHTHGGQIRIPGFGALLTSTKYWKLFEYGRYLHKSTGLEMIVTSGVGTTRVPLRLFCEPEAVFVSFQ
ncbi:MAG: hypothetical protein GXP32_05765 [Kiritimatiellaeota bacterium]|nr:hypothetical protein [Kiritimatiellota bacterium]